MSLIMSAPKIAEMARAKDPKAAILGAVGDLEKLNVNNDLVLVGTFIRNEMTAGGIIRPIDNVKEDEYQGKVGLVLKTGPSAFSDWEDEESRGQNAKLHSWVVYAIKDGYPVQINGTACRLIPYERLRMTVTDPNMVF